MIRRLLSPRGRVLRVRPGFNPNSSSVGFSVGFVEAGVAGLALAWAVLSTAIRVRRAVRHGEERRHSVDD